MMHYNPLCPLFYGGITHNEVRTDRQNIYGGGFMDKKIIIYGKAG
jgi:hypothetical protein